MFKSCQKKQRKVTITDKTDTWNWLGQIQVNIRCMSSVCWMTQFLFQRLHAQMYAYVCHFSAFYSAFIMFNAVSVQVIIGATINASFKWQCTALFPQSHVLGLQDYKVCLCSQTQQICIWRSDGFKYVFHCQTYLERSCWCVKCLKGKLFMHFKSDCVLKMLH